MLALLKEATKYLEQTGVGSIQRTLFYGTMPASPIGVTVVTAEGGVRSSIETGLRTPSVQVLVRDKDFDVAAARADKVFGALDNKWNVLQTIRGRFMADTLPGVYFKDANEYYVFSLNFNLVTTIANTL